MGKEALVHKIGMRCGKQVRKETENLEEVTCPECRRLMGEEVKYTTVRYDLIDADKGGIKSHPQKVMELLGYEVVNYEGGAIGDCVFIKVKGEINPMPKFLSSSDYEFISKDAD